MRKGYSLMSKLMMVCAIREGRTKTPMGKAVRKKKTSRAEREKRF
jgi:hypothetical protein